MPIAAVLLWLATASQPPVWSQNATADVIQRLGPRFGIDFVRDKTDRPHPSAQDQDAALRAGYGTWLNAELARPDDLISDPPAALRDYLRERSGELWEIVAALEKSAPDWGQQPNDVKWASPNLLPTILLERALLAAALERERVGDPIAANRILEASWSLGKPLVDGDFLIHQVMAVGILKLQAGALRKIQAPPAAWMNRLSGDASWKRMLGAVEREADSASGPSADPSEAALHRLHHAVATKFRRLSPCEASRQTEDEVWRDVERELASDPSPAARPNAGESPPTPTSSPGEGSAEPPGDRRGFLQNNLRNETGAIRRAAKLSVDRELTVKVLQLRLEAEASTTKRWPATFADTSSRVCPGASYVYRKDDEGIEIRFDGAVEAAGGEPVLPLSFRSGGSAPSTPATPPAGSSR